MRRIRRLIEDEDPLEGVANLFDLGLVFALGFLLALVNYLGLPELLQREDLTLVKDPGTPQMEIIIREGNRLERYRVSQERVGGDGVKLGTAYRLASGEVVYIPQAEAEPIQK